MAKIQYGVPLHIRGRLEDDMRHFLGGATMDQSAAAVQFANLCEGGAHGVAPTYDRSARTVWRVEGDGIPPPYVSVFDWGGHFPSVPELRVWYTAVKDSRIEGIGAFPATPGPHFPEQDEIRQRLEQILKAPGCYVVSD